MEEIKLKKDARAAKWTENNRLSGDMLMPFEDMKPSAATLTSAGL